MTPFKKVFVVRHGACDLDTDQINDYGREQITDQVTHIKSHVNEKEKIILLSSSNTRAQNSAGVIGGLLNVPYEHSDILQSGSSHTENTEGALAYITQKKDEAVADVVIIVTHMEYAQALPRVICESVNLDTLILFPKHLNMGNMAYINLIEEKVVYYN